MSFPPKPITNSFPMPQIIKDEARKILGKRKRKIERMIVHMDGWIFGRDSLCQKVRSMSNGFVSTKTWAMVSCTECLNARTMLIEETEGIGK